MVKIKAIDRFSRQCSEISLEWINISGRIGMNAVGEKHPKGLREWIDPKTNSRESGMAKGTDRKQVATRPAEIRIDVPSQTPPNPDLSGRLNARHQIDGLRLQNPSAIKF